MAVEERKTLTHLLDGMDHAAQSEKVSLADVLEEFGDRAITPFILIVALLLVSPLSGIPGVPTLSAAIIIMLSVQALFGRRRLWLPKRVRDLHLKGSRVRQAVAWMRRPCAFIDRHAKKRLHLLTTGPMRWVTLLVCVIIPMTWPVLELLPFITSVGAVTVSLLAFGLFTRDGLYVLWGYAIVGVALTAGIILMT